MSINDTILLAVNGTVMGQKHVHTLHFRCMKTDPVEQQLIDRWQATSRTTYRALFDDVDKPIELYRAQQVCGDIPLRAAAEEGEVAPNILGSSAFGGDDGPSWLAAVVSERTAFAGPSRRGRFYIGGLHEQHIAGNDLVSAHITRLTAYCTALLGEFGPAATLPDFRLVVHSHKLASVPGTECENSSTLVTALMVRAAVGSMKSRKPGSGT